MTHPLVHLDDVSFTYGSYLALNQVSFDLAPGELVVLAGRNGAGKSTLLRCIAGWSQATRGVISLMGTPIERAERAMRHHLALVPDMPPFYDDLTVSEHLQFIGQLNRVPNWKPLAASLLERFGLTSHTGALPSAMSRGQRYKLALSMALLVDPPLLLLDEPFGPLDPFSAGQLWDELWSRRTAGKTILLSSHQLPIDVEPDRYLIMENGEVLADGAPRDLCDTLKASAASLDALLRAAIEHVSRHGGRAG